MTTSIMRIAPPVFAIATLLFPPGSARAQDDTITIIGRFSSSVEFSKRAATPAGAFALKGNRIVFKGAKFTGMNMAGPLGKFDKATEQVLATVDAEAVVVGAGRGPNGRVASAHFTKVEVDYGGDGKVDLRLEKNRRGPSEVLLDLADGGRLPTNGAMPVRGFNQLEGYTGTLMFSGLIDGTSTDVTIHCVLHRTAK